MKKYIHTLVIAVAFFAMSSNVNAGWFGASFSDTPSLTLFGQTLKVPVPSLTLGKAAGTKVSASASSKKGVSVSLPFIKAEARSPELQVGTPEKKVSLSLEGVKKVK
tara:strand:+ start:2088 stop:2408 length:321 start_codon:yes stop_codon:yes gene_type:complete